MADFKHIPAGAYLIRNKKTGFVLEISDQEALKILTKFAHQDPHHRREQQIWWVEPLPGSGKNKDDEDLIYSISAIRLERLRALTVFRWQATAAPTTGFPYQKWRIKKVEDEEGEFYKIISVYNGEALGFVGEDPVVNSTCPVSAFATANTGQYWEFVVPNVYVPPGWIQIRNVSADCPLQHTYLACPPFLDTKAPTSTASNDSINWSSQWTFLLPKDRKENDPQNFWFIRNRLTQGVLSAHAAWRENGRDITVSAADSECNFTDIRSFMWRPEIHRDGTWVLVSGENSFVLEKGVDMDVQCKVKDTTGWDDRRKWEFVEYNKTTSKSVKVESSRQAYRVL